MLFWEQTHVRVQYSTAAGQQPQQQGAVDVTVRGQGCAEVLRAVLSLAKESSCYELCPQCVEAGAELLVSCFRLESKEGKWAAAADETLYCAAHCYVNSIFASGDPTCCSSFL